MIEAVPGLSRAHSQWLDLPQEPRYTVDDIEGKCKEIEKALISFFEEYCGDIEDSGCAECALEGIIALKKQIEDLIEEIQEMEDYQEPDPDYYEEESS